MAKREKRVVLIQSQTGMVHASNLSRAQESVSWTVCGCYGFPYIGWMKLGEGKVSEVACKKCLNTLKGEYKELYFIGD